MLSWFSMSKAPSIIRTLRSERGMSMEALAHAAGVTTPTVYRAEKGLVATSDATLNGIADALGVHVSCLDHHDGDASASAQSPCEVTGKDTKPNPTSTKRTGDGPDKGDDTPCNHR